MPDSGADPSSIAALLSEGGITMVPIYLCSIVALAVFVRKLLEFRGARLLSTAWLEPVLEHVRGGDYQAAADVCRGAANPVIQVVAAMVQALAKRPERAEHEAQRVGSLMLQKLEKNLALLSFIAQVAPLLGLLGTVLGMVDLFVDLQSSADQANFAVSELSGGIWKALLTTAAGLSVAVPALAAHSYLASRTDAVRLQLSDFAQRIMFASPARTPTEK